MENDLLRRRIEKEIARETGFMKRLWIMPPGSKMIIDFDGGSTGVMLSRERIEAILAGKKCEPGPDGGNI